MDPLFILCGFLAILIFVVWKMPGMIVILKWPFITFISLLFILCLILYSDVSVKAALKGINLWLTIVFPSLFPFFVASEILNSTGFVKFSGTFLEPAMRPLFNVPGCGAFALAMGVSSGYPVGAKITTELHTKGLLSKTEAERLLAFTNNSGPLFIIGAVATGMYKMPEIGIFLWVCHILAGLTTGMLFRFYKDDKKNGRLMKSCRITEDLSFNIREKNKSLEKFYHKKSDRNFKAQLQALKNPTSASIGTIFGDAVRNSIMLILAIGGFVILFSVIINLLLETGIINWFADAISGFTVLFGLDKEAVKACLCGFFEITTGTNLTSGLKNIGFHLQLAITSLIIGWAGLSVHSQVLSITSSTGISIKPYLFGKFLQGLFASIYTWIGIKFIGSSLLHVQAAFIPAGIEAQKFNFSYLYLPVIYSAVALTALYLLAAASSLIFRFVGSSSRLSRSRRLPRGRFL